MAGRDEMRTGSDAGRSTSHRPRIQAALPCLVAGATRLLIDSKTWVVLLLFAFCLMPVPSRLRLHERLGVDPAAACRAQDARHAQDPLRQAPCFSAPVIDEAGLFEWHHDDALKFVWRDAGVQLAVLTVSGLHGEPIEVLAHRVFDAWGLGERGSDRGLLLVMAAAERQTRLEVGYGLEGVLPDALARRMLAERPWPAYLTATQMAQEARGPAHQSLKRRAQATTLQRQTRRGHDERLLQLVQDIRQHIRRTAPLPPSPTPRPAISLRWLVLRYGLALTMMLLLARKMRFPMPAGGGGGGGGGFIGGGGGFGGGLGTGGGSLGGGGSSGGGGAHHG